MVVFKGHPDERLRFADVRDMQKEMHIRVANPDRIAITGQSTGL